MRALAATILLLSGCASVSPGAVVVSPATTVSPDAVKIIDTGGEPLVVVEQGAVSIPVGDLGPSLEVAAALASDNIGSPIAQVLQDNGEKVTDSVESLLPIGWLIAASIALIAVGIFIERVTDNKRS